MRFTASAEDNAKVNDAFTLPLRSAVEVDRPLTRNDALIIMVGTLVAGLQAAEQRIAELERALANHSHEPLNF